LGQIRNQRIASRQDRYAGAGYASLSELTEGENHSSVSSGGKVFGVVSGDLDILRLWNGLTVIKYSVGEIEYPGVCATVVIRSQIKRGYLHQLLKVFNSFWVDVAAILKYPLVGIGEAKDFAYPRQLKNNSPLVVVGILKFVYYDHRVPAAVKAPNGS
jgi:hypothetical protein